MYLVAGGGGGTWYMCAHDVNLLSKPLYISIFESLILLHVQALFINCSHICGHTPNHSTLVSCFQVVPSVLQSMYRG